MGVEDSNALDGPAERSMEQDNDMPEDGVAQAENAHTNTESKVKVEVVDDKIVNE